MIWGMGASIINPDEIETNISAERGPLSSLITAAGCQRGFLINKKG